jgi:hypothetical protein
VVKTLVDNGASLNLIMRKASIEMGLNLANPTPVHHTFHNIISRTFVHSHRMHRLEVSCGSEDNKCREMLTFEVASFDIGYNCILRRPFLLKFMAVIYTAYATMKISGSRSIITIKVGQRGTLTCENASLSHAGHFGDKTTQDHSVKVAKMQKGSTPLKTSGVQTTGRRYPSSTFRKERHLCYINIYSATRQSKGGQQVERDYG